MLVTSPIEEAVGTVSGVKRVTSVSREERSLVTVEFAWGKDIDLASMALREKIDLVKDRLPRGSGEPAVVRYNPFELPVLIVTLTGSESPTELLNLAEKRLKNEFEKMEGVASCQLSGGAKKEIAVDVDAAKLNAFGVPISDVTEGIKRANVNYPAGTIEEDFYEQMVRTVGEFTDVAELASVPLMVRDDERIDKPYVKDAVREADDAKPTIEGAKAFDKTQQPAYAMYTLRDMADVSERVRDATAFSRFNAHDAVTLEIKKRAGANTVTVAESVRRRLGLIAKTLPKGARVTVTYDQSVFISQAVRGVANAAVEGGVLAFLVLWFFLNDLFAAFLVACAIPVSVAAAFAAMYFGGVTLNMISLGGLALGIGMLVDNAVVVVETITDRRAKGESAVFAAIHGTKEVSGAVVSSTLTTVIVFAPVAFTAGVAGALFKELAFTVTAALLASLVVAFTMVPAVFRSRAQHLAEVQGKRRFLVMLEAKYRASLQAVLATPARMRARVVVAFAASVLLFPLIGKELMPSVDRGRFSVFVDMPPGTPLEVTDAVARKLEGILVPMRGVASVITTGGAEKAKDAAALLTTMGPHQARLIVTLRDAWFRAPSAVYAQRVRAAAAQIPLRGGQVRCVVDDNVFGSAFGGGGTFAVEVQGRDLDVISRVADTLASKMIKTKGFVDVRTSRVEPSPETRVRVDKEKAASFGVSVSDVAQTAQAAIDGKVASTFKREGKETDIRVRLRAQDRNDLEQLRRLSVLMPSGERVALGDIASISYGKGPTEILRHDQERTVVVSAGLKNLGMDAAARIFTERIVPSVKIPSGVHVGFAGEMAQMRESFKGLMCALALALLLVYMVMAAEFEDLRQPLLIMGTVPLALIGVVVACLLCGVKIGIMACLGMIVLGGIVVNNGIMLIDCINQRRGEGLDMLDAVTDASVARLRPILMTATTNIVGLLPLALGLSDGAALQRPMAVVIIGGMAVSTFLSLYVVPQAYCRHEKRRVRSGA
jgi:HAE1 family hydrophobic/amphiphilic exporter-1